MKKVAMFAILYFCSACCVDHEASFQDKHGAQSAESTPEEDRVDALIAFGMGSCMLGGALANVLFNPNADFGLLGILSSGGGALMLVGGHGILYYHKKNDGTQSVKKRL